MDSWLWFLLGLVSAAIVTFVFSDDFSISGLWNKRCPYCKEPVSRFKYKKHLIDEVFARINSKKEPIIPIDTGILLGAAAIASIKISNCYFKGQK